MNRHVEFSPAGPHAARGSRRPVLSMVLLGLGALGVFAGPNGCSHFSRGGAGAAAGELQPLDGSDLLVPTGAGLIGSWYTGEHQVVLHPQASNGMIPERVVFLFRQSGKTEWMLGPTWEVGKPAPSWSPPWDGKWEICAAPFLGEQPSAPPSWKEPGLIVAFDWTGPRLQVLRSLPSRPLAGGEELELIWSATDELSGAERVYVELRRSPTAEWETVESVPNTGSLRWQVPNTPLAGGALRLRALDRTGNSMSAEVPGRLQVQARAPSISFETPYTTTRRRLEIPYTVEATERSTLARVELWVTRDGGVTWNLAGYDHDASSPFEAQVEEGCYGVQMVVEDAAGNRSAYPAPGDAAHGELIVDGTAPTAEWGMPQVVRVEDPHGAPRELLEIRLPYRVRDLTLVPESIAFASKSGAGNWIDIEAAGPFASEGTIACRVPAHAAEPFTIRVIAKDRAGNVGHHPIELYPSELLTPPQLTFRGAPTGDLLGGAETEIAWSVAWPRAIENGVALFYRAADGAWTRIAHGLPLEGSHRWLVPDQNLSDSQLKLVVRSAQIDERHLVSDETFSIDGDPPIVRLLGPEHAHGDPISLLVDGQDGEGSGLDHYELHLRPRGTSSWTFAGRFEAGAGSIPLSPPAPGEYDLWIVAYDRAGNASPGVEVAAPGVAFELAVDDGPPGVRLVNFQDGGEFAGGSVHPVFLEWSGEFAGAALIDLEWSSDDGANWQTIGTYSASEKRILWELPHADAALCRLRASAREVTGRRSADQSRAPFLIDSSPPALTLGRVSATPAGRTRIDYTVEDLSGARPRRIWLYTSRDEGKHWERWQESFEASGPIEVDLPFGEVAIALTAEDSVGNISAEPRSGSQPMLIAQIGPAREPGIEILNPTAGTVAGGSRHYLFWKLEAALEPFPDQPVRVEYRLDGDERWRTIGENLPHTGKVAWTVPNESGRRIELRALACDVSGRVYESTSSEPLAIDGGVPVVLFASPQYSNTRPAILEYIVDDEESLESVELWVRAISTPEWKLTAVTRVGDRLVAEVPDGRYRVALVGVDPAGNRGAPPEFDHPGQGELLVDTVAPLLTIDEADGRSRVFHAGEAMTLRPRVQDRHLSAFPLSFRLREEGALRFGSLKEFHPNGEDFHWYVPEKPGFYQIEVIAEDVVENRASEIISVQVLPTPPTITLLTNPAGSVLRGGEELYVEWESRGVDGRARTLEIQLSTDGEGWTTLLAGQGASGSARVRLPEVDSNRCQLRLFVSKEDGSRGVCDSGVFSISTTLPRVRIDGVRAADPPRTTK